jgi:hypothetical protein
MVTECMLYNTRYWYDFVVDNVTTSYGKVTVNCCAATMKITYYYLLICYSHVSFKFQLEHAQLN